MSSLRVQIPWQRRGSCLASSRRPSAIFLQQQDESGDEEDDGQQLRLEVPRLVHSGVSCKQEVDSTATQAGGGGGPQEGDLDVFSATSSASGHVHTSSPTTSRRERRAQIDCCWCNVPDMFLDPAGAAAYYWMALVTLAVIYNWIVIILRMAFEDMRDHETPRAMFRVADVVSDVIYLLDVAIQSRTAFLMDGCLVKTLPDTVRHYRSQSHFALDVLSVVPVTLLLSYFSKISEALHVQPGSTALTTPGLRILRLLKYHSMNKFFEKTDSRTNNPNLLRAFKLSLHLWLVIHWIGCFYYLLSQHEGLGSNDWVYPNSTGFSEFRRKYIYCMYWSTMTLTTIGERPWPVTDAEYIFTGITFLIGVFVFAAVVGNVGDVISNMNAARHDFQARMDQIKFYLNYRHVPEHLQDQIKRWAEYTWARTKAIDEHSMLQMLPIRLRTEVAIHVHLQTLKKVRIFEQCEEGLLRELVTKLKPCIYSPGEYICRIGEIGREMYIIDHGKVEILFPDRDSGQKKQVAIMLPGNYFGEISLLKVDDGQNKRTADVRSIGFSELLRLSRRDLMSALTEYPEAKKILEAQARQRVQQTKWTPSTDPDNPEPSSSDTSSAGAQGSGRRSAKAIFAEVMKQEGFSRLLSTKAYKEMSEMREILKEIKEIKAQAAQWHVAGPQPQEKAQDSSHLTQRKPVPRGKVPAISTPDSSNQSSPCSFTLSSPPSDSSTITPPTTPRSPPLPGSHASPSPPGSASGTAVAFCHKHPHPSSMATDTGGTRRSRSPSDTSLRSSPLSQRGKCLPASHCAVYPRHAVHAVGVQPSCDPRAVTVNKRQRRSSLGRAGKVAEEERHAESNDKCGELEPDSGVVHCVTQTGGGGDELNVLSGQKASDEKDDNVDVSENTHASLLSRSNSSDCIAFRARPQSSSDMCSSEHLAAGGGTTGEMDISSSVTLSGKPPDSRSTESKTWTEPVQEFDSSDSFKSLASESNTSSQNTSYTDSSTTSSSSGGRGHSPKPAKPRPRYKADQSSDSNSQSTGSEDSRDNLSCKEKGELITGMNELTGMSSEGFSAMSVGSSSGPSELSVSISTQGETDSLTADLAALTATCIPEGKAAQQLPSADTAHCVSQGMGLTESATARNKVCKSVVIVEPETGGQDGQQVDAATARPSSLSAESVVSSAADTGQAHLPSTGTLCRSDEQQDELSKEKFSFAVPENLPEVDDNFQDGLSYDTGDSDMDCGSLIPATRVKSDFDKRVSVADLPKVVKCRKINDKQLSVLLAKRREVNDSADYTVESPGRSSISLPANGRVLQALHADHGHAVRAVINHFHSHKDLNSHKNTSEPSADDLGESDSGFSHSAQTVGKPNTDGKETIVDPSTQKSTCHMDMRKVKNGCNSPASHTEYSANRPLESEESSENHTRPAEASTASPDSAASCISEHTRPSSDDTVDSSHGLQTCAGQFECELCEYGVPVSTAEPAKRNYQCLKRAHNEHATLQMTAILPKQRAGPGETSAGDTPDQDSGCHFGMPAQVLPRQSPEAPHQPHQGELEENNLAVLRRRYSASRYRRRSLDHSREQSGTASWDLNHDAPASFSTSESLTDSPQRIPQNGEDGYPNLPQKHGAPSLPATHSEQLELLIAKVDSAKRCCEQAPQSAQEMDNSTCFQQKTKNLTEAKEKMNESTEMRHSQLEQHVSKPPIDKHLKEEDNPCAASTSPQKHKTLRRRCLTKRLSNPYEKKEMCNFERKKAACVRESTDDSACVKHGSGTDRDTSYQQPAGDGATVSVALTKNLVRESDMCHDVAIGLGSSSTACEMSFDLVKDRKRSECPRSEPDSVAHHTNPESNSSTSSATHTAPYPSPSRCPSSKDRPYNTAKQYTSRDTLDRANNSLRTFPWSLSSSDSPSPPDCFTTSCVVQSYDPTKPMELLPPELDLAHELSVCDSLGAAGAQGPLPLDEISPAIGDDLPDCCDRCPDTTAETFYCSRLSAELSSSRTPSRPSHKNACLASEDCPQAGFMSSAQGAGNELRSQLPGSETTGQMYSVTIPEIHISGEDNASASYQHGPLNHHVNEFHTGAHNSLLWTRSEEMGDDGAQLEEEDPDHSMELGMDMEELQEEGVLEHMVGNAMVNALHLHPNLLDWPGASSTDDSVEEEEGEEERDGVGSLILLTDFGVVDDDEGALSDVSGCADHSDVNSDLDEL